MGVKIKIKYESECDFITEEMHMKVRKGKDRMGNFYIRKDLLNLVNGANSSILYRVNEETYMKIILDDEDWWKWKSFSC